MGKSYFLTNILLIVNKTIMKDDLEHTLFFFKFGFECIKRTYVSNFNGKAVPCNCSLKPYRKFAIICSSKFDMYLSLMMIAYYRNV